MGKKAKTLQGLKKAASRRVDKATLPPPPLPPEEELGSAKLLDEASMAGGSFKVMYGPGFDDGGVADLSLLIDLEDSTQRRRRGDNEYFTQLKADQLPRATRGPMAHMSRRDQKVSLAQLLFSDDAENGGVSTPEDKGPSEVYMDQNVEEEDPKVLQARAERLSQARAALRLSLLLREPACASLSLTEIAKRKLALSGKAGAEDSLRCAQLAVDIASDGFWDTDEVTFESMENPKIPANYEKNATTPGLAHPSVLKYTPLRASHLCLRSAHLQRGNALAALGREDEARESYTKVVPILEKESRCGRIDWERHSLYINIGNTFSRSGDFESADEQYTIAEKIGKEHLEVPNGSISDGKAMIASAKRARAFALKKIGKIDEAKALIKEVVEQQIKDDAEEAAKKKKEEQDKTKENAEASDKKDDNKEEEKKG